MCSSASLFSHWGWVLEVFLGKSHLSFSIGHVSLRNSSSHSYTFIACPSWPKCTKIARFSAVFRQRSLLLPTKSRLVKAPRCAISWGQESVAKCDFLCDENVENWFPLWNTCLWFPSLRCKIAGEWRRAILVHSALGGWESSSPTNQWEAAMTEADARCFVAMPASCATSSSLHRHGLAGVKKGGREGLTFATTQNAKWPPPPHIQCKTMNKYLDKLWPQMLQNKANSTVLGAYICSCFCLVLKNENPPKKREKHTPTPSPGPKLKPKTKTTFPQN